MLILNVALAVRVFVSSGICNMSFFAHKAGHPCLELQGASLSSFSGHDSPFFCVEYVLFSIFPFSLSFLGLNASWL
jgi:hypothetical protein